jgi:hypothetical protein
MRGLRVLRASAEEICVDFIDERQLLVAWMTRGGQTGNALVADLGVSMIAATSRPRSSWNVDIPLARDVTVARRSNSESAALSEDHLPQHPQAQPWAQASTSVGA